MTVAGTNARRVVVAVALLLSLVSRAAAQTVEPVIVGPNVNMVGGPAIFQPPSTLIGDPFLQRQNEPSLAVSSRNPCHLLAGANDYRAVDLEEAAGEVGDAWLGLFKSFDCGATWTSTLLPGHRLDTSPEGLASPIRGLQAGADPTVRAGTSGLFYYSGIAFNRGDGEVGKVFVSRFIDHNNKDGGDPIQYLGTAQIDVGTSGQFLDKPWIVADIPRNGATCVIEGRTIPAGNVYLLYTSFVGGDNNVRSKILFSRSTDCGVTWSNPSKLSEQIAKNQGTTIAIDPGTGALHVAWREFSSPDDSTSRNAIVVARSTDGGRSFTRAARIAPGGYTLRPFDQASSQITFRTNAYPTIAVVPAETEGRGAGQPGRVYVAWAARGFVPLRPGQLEGDARVVVSTSIGGDTWTPPSPVDSYPGAGHQIMPALAFAGGKLALAYYDLREDRSLGFDDLVMEYGQAAFEACLSESQFGFGAVLACMANPSNVLALTRRHTLDMRAALADASCLATGSCAFTSYSVVGGGSRRVSRYIEGFVSSINARAPVQYNRPNLPLFSKGRFPFIGDYIDIAGQNFVALPNGGWAWNTGLIANQSTPVFHVTWADNRNVGSPRDLNWERFTPAVLGPNMVQCVPGQAGVRNQDVYTAQLRPGLIVSVPHNSKRVAGLQRSFVVVVQNATSEERDYTLTLASPSGVVASFNQFLGFDGSSAPTIDIRVRIPRRSAISRTAFVALENAVDPNAAPDILVPVTVSEVEIDPGGIPIPTGVVETTYLNPDFENPDFENPDFENAELHNPDFENPDFENPDFENPDFENFTLSATTAIRNPDFENPDFENPDFENPDFENPDFENPDWENPDFENPDFENPDFENPDFENPDFENPDFENGAFEVTDITWPVRNDGNTTSAYKANVFVNNPPEGVQYQLVVRRVYPSPASVCALPASTSPTSWAQNQAAVNIVGPNINASLFDSNFNDSSRDNATFYLSPGERASVTLRAYCAQGDASCTRSLMASFEGNVALGVVAQGANCVVCEGAACSIGDMVGGVTECRVDDGPPKDVYDPVPPTVALLAPAVPSAEDADNTGDEVVTFVVSATDNVAVSSLTCTADGVVVTLGGANGSQYAFSGDFPVGTTEVTCTASDVRATPGPNTSSVTFSVFVTDVTPPTFDPSNSPGAPFSPGNPAEATSPQGAQVFYTNPAATDSNGGDVSVTCASAGGLVSGSTFPIGTTPINCTATDESGISTPPTNLFSISVADTTAPVVTVSGAPATSVEGNQFGGSIVIFSATAVDGVSGAVSTSCTPSSGSLFAVGTTTVTCSAEDAAGNDGSTSFAVTIVDTTPPAVTVTGNGSVTIEAGSVFVDGGATAADIVAGAVPVTTSGSVNVQVPGVYAITYQSTDPSGNIGSAIRTVTVVDTTAPVFDPVGSITREATSPAGAVATFTVTADDSVDDAVTIGCAPVSGSTFPLGTTTVHCTATDSAHNSATTSFSVIVVDTTSPVLTLPGGLTREATSAAGAVVTYAVSSSDIAGASSVACSPTSGSAFALGSTSVSCTATDTAGNTSAGVFSVNVVDTTAPVLAVPSPITAQATGPAGATVSYTATAVDVVDATPTVSCVPTSGSVFAFGATAVTCTARDDAGNTSQGGFTVSVIDTVPPGTFTASVSPRFLWPPNAQLTPVTISGTAVDAASGAARIAWSVVDEYGQHQPSGSATLTGNGAYSFQILLLNDRRGNDKNGREYRINMTLFDASGNPLVLGQPLVVQVHDQSGK